MAEVLIAKKRLERVALPVKTATKIQVGEGVCLDATGDAVPASVSSTLTTFGVCLKEADNSNGADGDIYVDAHGGEFAYAFANSAGGDELTILDKDEPCYWAGPNTVAKTDGSGTRSFAGVVHDVDENGVWVKFSGIPATIAALAATQVDVVDALTGGGIVRHYDAPVAPVTTPDADGEATSVALANALKAAYNDHRTDTDLHSAADSTNAVTTADATNLASAQTLLNEIKVDFNAHVAATVHRPSTWTPATVTTADASDQSTANALANALKRALNAHIASGLED